MSKKKTALLLRQYVWLVGILQNRRLTYEEICDRWECSNFNDKHEPLKARTLQRHISAIRDLFGIEIVCSRKNESRYTIADNGDLESDRMKKWLYSTFSISALASESELLRERILLEEIPSGETYLTQIIEAMRDSVVLKVEYKDFKDKHSRELLLCPYCVKLYRRRWYMIADGEDGTKKYSLDRIRSLTPTGDTFTMSKMFDPKKYFENVIGITNTEKVEQVVLKVDNSEGKVDYFRSLPLHTTQREIPVESDEYEDCAFFEYHLCHTYDLYQEIMTHAYDVEVLKPLKLREEIKKVAESMAEAYSKPSIMERADNIIDRAIKKFLR